MKLYNRIDEQNRFMGFYATQEAPGQCDSHGYSYLAARDMYKDAGMAMGLDRYVEREE